MNNFFTRGLDYSQLIEEFKLLYLEVPHVPVPSNIGIGKFDKRELKRFRYLIDNVHAYMKSHVEGSFDTEFEQMCLFYFDVIQIYIFNTTKNMELTNGIATTIMDTSLLLFPRIHILSSELAKSLSFFADYLFDNQNLFDLPRLSTQLMRTLPDETYHSILTALYVDSNLGIEGLYNLYDLNTLPTINKMQALDVKITSMLNLLTNMGDAYVFDSSAFTLIKFMCVTYLQCDPAERRHDLGTHFKLMSFLALVEPLSQSVESRFYVSEILYSMGTSIYGEQYDNITNTGHLLGIKPDMSFWKDNFQSLNLTTTALPDNII